ncbi:mucin-2-like [Sycon ciliatum]|uniref:mucin-2-like n=1 Tax=Sycon ciliatum TaxID=27933 RepID=UPI0031F6088E
MIEAENKRRAACDQPPLKVEAFTMSNCTSSSPCSSEESADAKTDYTFASPTDIPMETENSLAPRSLMLPSPCSISDKSTSTRSSSLPAIAFSPVGAISALRGALPHAQPIAWTGDRAAEPASSPSHKSTSAAAACHPSSSCHLESSATARISKGDKGDRKAQRPATLLPSHYITVQQQQQTNASPPSHSVSSIATPVHAEQPAPPVQPVQPVPNITIAPPAPPAASAMIVQAPTVSNTAMFSPATVRMPFQVVHQFPAAQPAAVAAAAAPMYKDPSTLSLAQASGSARFLPSSHVTVPRLQPLHVISVIPTASPMHIPASTIPYPPQHAMQLAPVQAVQTVQPAQQAAAAVALPQLQQQQQPPQIMVLQYTPTTSPNHPDTAAAVSVGHGSTASTAQSSPQYPVVTSTTQYRSADGQLYPIAIVPAPQQGIPVTTITHDT